MGRSKKADKKKKPAVTEDDGGLVIDPARIRFQHSKIRPYFSGCGRSVEATLESIRQKEISPSDLPPILVRLMQKIYYFKLSAIYFISSYILFCVSLQVIVGPETADGPWYFGLNSRRLWVLKKCREEGLLENNRIYVRVRECKSDAEASRYSVANCALEAKIVPDKPSGEDRKSQDEAGKVRTKVVEDSSEDDADEGRLTSKNKGKKKSKEVAAFENLKIGGGGSSDEDSDSDDEPTSSSNRFSALF
jgi:hypothetical protein